MTNSKQFDLPQLEKLVASATNPRQKAMYQSLLDKAKQQLQAETSETTDQVKPPEGSEPPKETKKTRKTKAKQPSDPLEQPETAIEAKKTKAKKTGKSKSTDDQEDNLTPVKAEVQPEVQPEVQEVVPETVKEVAEKALSGETEAQEGPLFQAIGMISGQVQLNDEGQNTITIGDRTYPLLYVPSKRRAWDALTKEIKTTGQTQQRLIVYPKAIHFPQKDQDHRIAFQVVGFDKGKEDKGITKELKDLEFKISGLWQFIPVCRVPCISILRNFTKQRLEYIKQADPAKKVRFMKASHLPLLWKDSPVKPFRFNPKLEKEEQGHAPFVQVKAKFLPGRDVFGFMEELAVPQETAPRYLKASKKDKSEALKSKSETKAAEKS